MKTIQTSAMSLMLALLTSTTLLAQPEFSAKAGHEPTAFASRSHEVAQNHAEPTTSPELKTFGIGLYRIQGSMTVRLTMQKQGGQKAVVRLLNAKGQVMHQEVIGRSTRKYACNFDFSDSQDGQYTLEVANGGEVQRKAIHLSTSEVVEVPARTLVAMK